MREELVTVSIAAEDITFRTSGRVTTMKWPLIRELRIFPEVLLLVMDGARSNYVGMPAAPLGAEFRNALEDKVKEHGGKVGSWILVERGFAEMALLYGTLLFLVLWVPAIIGFYMKADPKLHPHTLFNYVALGLMTIWPVAHFWGYFGRNKVCAAIAALVHNLFGSYIIAAVWFACLRMDRGLLGVACGGSLFALCFLFLGFLLMRLRVTKKRRAVYIYFAITVLVIASVMLEAALE